jgi:hypothetical protein
MTGAEGSAEIRQRVTAALASARTGSSPRATRRSAKPVTPPASAASCRRREAVSPSLPCTSPTTAASPRWRSPSSITNRTDLPASAMISRSGCSPAAARAGANRSCCSITQSTMPAIRATNPATNRLAAAPCSTSGPAAATSCRQESARPPAGRCTSTTSTPSGRTARLCRFSPAPVASTAPSSRAMSWRSAIRLAEPFKADLSPTLGTYNEQNSNGRCLNGSFWDDAA